MKNIIIADDCPIILDGLTDQISCMNIFESVISVQNGFELLDQLKKYNTDLLIIDIAMPKMSGFDVVKKIRLLNRNILILMMSNFNNVEIILKSLLLGANGFVHKMNFVNEISTAIETIVREEKYFTSDLIKIAESNQVDYFTGLECYEIKRKLSYREYEVFRVLGKLCECSEIADELQISIKTIHNHIEKTKKKLEVKSKNELCGIAKLHYTVYN